jgi:hypothetical protein
VAGKKDKKKKDRKAEKTVARLKATGESGASHLKGSKRKKDRYRGVFDEVIVETVAPGAPAAASVDKAGGTLRLAIPRGEPGAGMDFSLAPNDGRQRRLYIDGDGRLAYCDGDNDYLVTLEPKPSRLEPLAPNRQLKDGSHSPSVPPRS